ncbi:hypothetical protein [Streptomyces sp. NPDC057580]|uniref:hypothetical protein n=1 Tax=Streptomyces sp. NPDC057580 TaxID=3346173 RepID=UPI0036A184E0
MITTDCGTRRKTLFPEIDEANRGEVVAGVLRRLEAVGVGQALDAHPGSKPGLGTTRARPKLVKVRSGGVCTGSVRNIECGAPWCPRGCRASPSGAHQSGVHRVVRIGCSASDVVHRAPDAELRAVH